MSAYFQGQAIRFSVTVNVAGTLTNPTVVQLNIQPPGGAAVLTFTSPTNDSIGAYHWDYLVPLNAAIGTWWYWWTTTGGPVAQNGVSAPTVFTVNSAPT